MVCPYLEDLWELYLLDALSVEDARAVSDHLDTGCAQCGEQLRDAAMTVYLLLQPGHAVRPQPNLKASLMRRLKRP
jgi:hypothetical protein